MYRPFVTAKEGYMQQLRTKRNREGPHSLKIWEQGVNYYMLLMMSI